MIAEARSTFKRRYEFAVVVCCLGQSSRSSGEFGPWPEHSARPPPPTPDARVMSPIVRGVHRLLTRARSFFARFLFIRNQGRERVESGS